LLIFLIIGSPETIVYAAANLRLCI